MKSFVKRFLSSAIAAAMLLTSAAFPTIASAAEVTYLYADLYGIDVVMSEAVGDPDTHTVEVTDSTGAPVDFTLMAMAEGETLATDVLSINFTTPINIGEVYTVTVDGTEKAFRVNKYSSVDFNNQAAGTNVVDKREIKDGDVKWMVNPWPGTTTAGQNDGVDMITDNADFGASSADKKLILYNRDSGFALVNDMPTMDATIYADVTMYGMNSANVGANDFFLFGKGNMRNDAHNLTLSSSAVETKQAHAQLKAVTDGLVNDDEHKYFDENGKYIKGSGGDPVYDYYASVWNGTIDMNLKDVNANAKARTASYGAAASVAGKLTSITVDNQQATLAEQFTYEIDKSVVPTTVRAAARVYDNNPDDEVSGYYGGFAGIAGEDSFNYTGTSLDETTRLYSHSLRMKMGMSSNATNLKVVDNVLITTCSVADSNVEAPAVTGYYADLYGVDLVYAEDPTEAIDALVVNPVIRDEMGNIVASSFELNTKTNVVSVLADEMLELNTVYTISAGDFEKTFYVEKVFEENFNAQTAGNSYANNVSGSNNGITWMASGAPNAYGGAFITSDEKLGANNNDKKAVLYQRDTQIKIENTLPNVTFYATTQTYDFVRTADAGQMLFTSGTSKTKGHLYKFNYNTQQIYLSSANSTNADYTSKWDGVPEADYVTRFETTNGVISKTDTTIPADKNLDGEDDAWQADHNTTSDAADKVINFGTVTKAPEVKRAMRSYDFNTEDANPGYFGGFSALEGEKATYTGTGYNNKTGEIKEECCGLFVSTASILVADDLMITTFVDVDPDREPAAVTKMYGDSYGLEIEFDKEPIAFDYLGLQITDADGNEVEVASTEVNGTTIRLTYKEMLARDVKHTISFGNNRRAFVVKTAFEENFDDITENVDPAALATITENDWSATNAIVTADSKWGAKAADKKLLLHNKGTFNPTANVDNEMTVSAVIENYHNGNINSVVGVAGRFYPDPQYLWVGNNTTDNYRIVQEGASSALASDNGSLKTADGSNIRPVYPSGMGGASLPTTVVKEDPIEYAKPTNIAWGLIGYGYGVSEYPYEKQPYMQLWNSEKIDSTNTKGWAPANVTDAEGNVVYRDIKGDVTAPQVISNIAMRVNGGEIDYFADFTGKAMPSLLATGVLTDAQKITADTVKFGYYNNAQTVTLLDDLLVTRFVDIDPDAKAPAVTNYYADLYGVDLVYDTDPTTAVETLLINPVIKDAEGKVVPSSVQANAASKVVSVLADEMLELNTVYTISAGDYEKKFFVSEVFEEDFNAKTASNSYAYSVSGSNNGIIWTLQGSPNAYGGAFITSDEKLGASNNDKKAVLYQRDAQMRIENKLPNVTFYATTQTYDFITTADANQMLYTSGTGKTKGHLYKLKNTIQQINLSSAYIAEGSAYYDTYHYKWDGVPEAGYTTNLVTTNGVISKTDTTIPADKNLDGEDDTWKADNKTTSAAADKVINFGTVTKAPEVKRAMRAYDFNTEDADPGYFGGFSALEGKKAVYTGTGYNNKTGEIKEEECGLFLANASILVADDLMITKFVEVDPNRKAAAVVGDPYADIYGIDVEFDKEPLKIEYAATILDKNKDEVAFTTAVETITETVAKVDENGATITKANTGDDSATYPFVAETEEVTKYIVHYDFVKPIARDEAYRITIGDNFDKFFTAKTVIFENFDNLADATTAVDGSFLQGDSTADANSKENDVYKVKGSGWFASMNVDGNKKYSGAWIADTQLGSEKGNKKLALLGTSTAMRNAIQIPLNSTISADIQGYFLTGAAQSQSLIGYVDSHGSGKANAYSIELPKTGTANLGWAYYSNDSRPNPSQNNRKSVNYTAPVGELNVATAGTFTPNDSVKTAGKAVTSVVRTYDNVLAGYMIENGSAVYMGTMLDTSDAGKLKTATPKQLRNISNFAIESRGDLTVVDNVLITTSVIENAVEAEIKDVYADIYGLEIAFEAEPSKMQKENIVVENARGAKVEFTTEYDADLGVIRATFAEPIKTDIAYKLSIGDSYLNKGLIVNKVFEENFDAITENVDPEALATITGEDWSATNAIVTADSKWGARAADKKLLIHNGGNFAQTTTVDGKKATVSAKIENYYNGGIVNGVSGSFWIESEWLWFGKANGNSGNFRMKQYRDSNILSGADGKGFKYMDGKDFRPFYNIQGLTVPTTIDETTGYYTKPSNTSIGLIGYGYGVSEYPYVKQQKMNLFTEDGTWKPTAVEGEFIDISADPVTSPRVVSNMAMRMTDNLTVFGDYTGEATPKYLASTVISDAQALTTTTNKFGYQTKNTVALLDNILVTTCTIQDEFVATGPVAINVTDIYGKADGVYVEFDEALEATDNFKDIEVYEDGDRVDTTATVNGNVVKLAVDGDIKSGAIYRVVVPAKYQPNEDFVVETESAKNFKLTIYADSIDDVELATDSGVAAKIGDKLVLRGGEFTLPNVNKALNYNVSFDAKVYTTAMTDANNDEENAFAHYNKVTPTGIKMWYNGAADNKANGYEWAIGSESLTKNVYSADGMNSQAGDAVPYAPIAFGDALYADGDFTVFTGEEDEFENWMLAADNNATLEDDFDIVLKSQRTAANYKVSVEKSGKKATYSLNGEIVSSFDGTENAAGASEGIFGVSASVEEFVVIENIYAYSYEEIKDIAIELTEDNKVKVNNVSSTEKPVVIVVATYDSNNAMIDAWVADGVNSLAGFGEYNESYTVDTTGAVKTKAFVWDSMTSLIPYCTPAQK